MISAFIPYGSPLEPNLFFSFVSGKLLDQEPVDAAPLSMKPAASGSKALLVCADGNVDASWLAKFAAESKSAGATVDLCPLNSERLRSHASTAGGTYDFVVVEALGVNEDSGVVLGEVRDVASLVTGQL